MTIINNALKTYFKTPTSVCNLFVGNIPHNHLKRNTEQFYTHQKSIYIYVNDRERKYPLKIN